VCVAERRKADFGLNGTGTTGYAVVLLFYKQ